MKKKFGFMALLLAAVFMLSSCELFQTINAFKDLADSISDYNSVYVKNGTSGSITVSYEENADSVDEGATQQKGSFTLKKGATKEKALIAGYFKLTVDGEQVMPGEGASTYEYLDSGYYVLQGNTKITIVQGENGLVYTQESRTSSTE